MNRRQLLGYTSAAVLGSGLGAGEAEGRESDDATVQPAPAGDDRFLLGLNTSTIRGQNLGIVREVELAAQAGFGGIEPWIGELEAYRQSGGLAADLKKRIEDAGLRVESVIGFFDWVVDDEAQRRRGLEAAKKSMELVREIGGTRIAAPPVGATKQAGMDLRRIAERYRILLEAGESIGVVPQVEIWGFSKTLGRLSEAAYVAIESGHPSACILPDVYHLYRGGSDFSGISLLGPNAIHVFHLNDYPARPPRSELTDADRVFPGDGIAPLGKLLDDLRRGHFRVMLSLELFHRDYWKRDPLAVLQEGIRKLRAIVETKAPAKPAQKS
jgi:sugar phosphate isomerase/epimerase